ncbi:hypothetical protein X777_16103, partial [Ooceraea biroi]
QYPPHRQRPLFPYNYSISSRARASPSLIGGLCPAATLSAAPRMQTTLFVGRAAEEGLVRSRLSGRSPGISEGFQR